MELVAGPEFQSWHSNMENGYPKQRLNPAPPTAPLIVTIFVILKEKMVNTRLAVSFLRQRSQEVLCVLRNHAGRVSGSLGSVKLSLTESLPCSPNLTKTTKCGHFQKEQ